MKFNLSTTPCSFANLRFLIALVFLALGLTPANPVVAGTNDKHKTEATGAQCWDCAVDPNQNLRDVANYLHPTAYFSGDKTHQTFIDRRVKLDRVANPQLNAVGTVDSTFTTTVPPRKADAATSRQFKGGLMQTIASGEGFMLNECLFVTGHHVVYGSRNEKDVSLKSIKVSLGMSDNPQLGKFAHVSNAEIAAQGSFGYDGTDGSKDKIILKLDESVYDPNNPKDPRIQWKIPIGQKHISEVRRKKFLTASFYPDLTQGEDLYGEEACTVAFETEFGELGTHDTDCAAIKGDSGSPIMTLETIDGRKQLFAYGVVHSAITGVRTFNRIETYPDGSNNLNTLTPLKKDGADNEIQRIIDLPENKCPPKRTEYRT